MKWLRYILELTAANIICMHNASGTSRTQVIASDILYVKLWFYIA